MVLVTRFLPEKSLQKRVALFEPGIRQAFIHGENGLGFGGRGALPRDRRGTSKHRVRI